MGNQVVEIEGRKYEVVKMEIFDFIDLLKGENYEVSDVRETNRQIHIRLEKKSDDI